MADSTFEGHKNVPITEDTNTVLSKSNQPTPESTTATTTEVIDTPKDSAGIKPVATIRLLLVDDDIVDRKIILRILNSNPLAYKVDEAVSKDEALELFKTTSYDCILLDFRLGDTDALEILSKLKQLSPDNRVAIVLVTGMGSEHLAAQVFKAGVQDYVVKSNLHAHTLFPAIEHAIQSVRLERENEQQIEELEFFNLHDHLTGMPNRKLFYDQLEQNILRAKNTGVSFSICSMDLDRFKQINDTLGHDVGDQVLVEVAKRMTGALRSSDMVARFGGDEFIALLDIPNIQSVITVAEKLIASVAEPIMVNNTQIDVGLSVGISTFSENNQQPKALLKQADQAMYSAKNSSSDIVLFSDHDLSKAKADKKSGLILDGDTLVVEYQPQINLLTNQMVGVEALVSWRHPDLGLLSPAEFMPILEREQQMRLMNALIAEAAIKQCAQWRAGGYNIPISVNVFARLPDSMDLPEMIGFQLEKWDLPGDCLTLEMAEKDIFPSLKTTVNILHQLSVLGVRISIDNFGSGHTSFCCLRDCHFNELKIDSRLIDNLINGRRDESIIKAILALGEILDMKVIAEGIADEKSLAILKTQGCEFGQGAHLAEAVSAENLLDQFSCNSSVK